MPDPPAPPMAPSPGSRGTTLLACFALAAVVAVLFGRVVDFPFLDWDDVRFIANNPLVTHPARVDTAALLFTPDLGYIVPVSAFAWRLLYGLGGGEPWPFHLANLLLHCGCAVLVLLLARRLELGLVAGFAAAVLFAVHPIVAEPVAWATGLKDLLSSCLVLGATFVALPLLRHEPCRRPTVAAGTALALATLAMLAKPTVLLIGPVWILVACAHPEGGLPPRRVYLAPLAATLIGALLALFNYLARRELNVDDLTGTAGGSPLLALGHQFSHLLWPDQLHPLYCLDRMAGLGDPHTWVGLITLVGFVAAIVAGRRYVAILLGGGLAAAAYLPTSNIIPFNRFISDSYIYLPLAGLALVMAQVIHRVRRPPAEGRAGALWRPTGLLLGFVVIVSATGTLTWRQIDRWRSHRALWQPVTRQCPGWEVPHLLLAQGLRYEGRIDAALSAYRGALDARYEDRALDGMAATLVDAARLQAAECVLAEQLLLGKSKQRAAHNLALLLATQEAFRPRYPAIAARAAQMTLRSLAAGKTRWPDHWVQDLNRRLAELQRHPSRQPEPWGKRRCAVLRSSRGRP